MKNWGRWKKACSCGHCKEIRCLGEKGNWWRQPRYQTDQLGRVEWRVQQKGKEKKAGWETKAAISSDARLWRILYGDNYRWGLWCGWLAGNRQSLSSAQPRMLQQTILMVLWARRHWWWYLLSILSSAVFPFMIIFWIKLMLLWCWGGVGGWRAVDHVQETGKCINCQVVRWFTLRWLVVRNKVNSSYAKI